MVKAFIEGRFTRSLMELKPYVIHVAKSIIYVSCIYVIRTVTYFTNHSSCYITVGNIRASKNYHFTLSQFQGHMVTVQM